MRQVSTRQQQKEANPVNKQVKMTAGASSVGSVGKFRLSPAVTLSASKTDETRNVLH